MSKYKAYPEYKDSGVEWLGDIPNDWDIKSLKNIAVIVNGSTPKSGVEEYWDGDINWITPTDLSQKLDVYLKDSQRKITNEGLNSCGTSLVPENTVILSTRAPIGSLAITGAQSCTNQGCKSLVVRYKDHSLFLYYYLSISTNSLNNLGRGSTFLELSTEDLGSFKVPMPNEGIGKIVSFLDHETAKIDNLIEKQQQLIELLKEKRQAVISHAVTKGLNPDVPMKDSGVEWLGEVPEHWDVTYLKHIIADEKNAIVDGPFGSSVNTDTDYVDHGVPVIRTVNISNAGFSPENLKFMRLEKYKQLKRHSVKPRDILFSKVGTIGNACILPSSIPEAILSTTGSCKITVNQEKIIPEYLVFLIHSMNEQLMQIANANVQPFLNMSNIKGLKIPLPKIVEQSEILKKVKSNLQGIDQTLSESNRLERYLTERRTALISAAVTGKIDVRDWVAPGTSDIEAIEEATA